MATLNLQCFTKRALAGFSAFGLAVLLGCSGGSGQPVAEGGNFSGGNGSGGLTYNGPAPLIDDVTSFKLNVWDNLAVSDRCGACHNQTVGQVPMFVRSDDINLAYNAIAPNSPTDSLVDLAVPANSRLVQKVAGGHSCWGNDPAVCAEIVSNYIDAWAKDLGVSSNVVVLTAPDRLKTVGESRSFPPSAAESNFAGVHNLLEAYCGSCHSEEAALKQQPYIGASDIEVAYQAARSKINLDESSLSRLVVRLRSDFHNCWSNCSSDATEMDNAIKAFANAIEVTSVDPALKVSNAIGLDEGIVASSGGRVESNVIALYEFKRPSLKTVYDTSGVGAELNLNITGDVERVGGWGLRINNGKAQATTATSRKLYDMIRITGEYSIEAWVVPDNVSQDGPARIVTYSGGSDIRNFTLGQSLYNYNFLNRSSKADANGMPMLSTADGDDVLQATLQHVVASYDTINGSRLYVNGKLVASDPESAGANLNNWDDTFAFAIGNEVDDNHLWQGTIKLLAIHNRVLTEENITTNFDAGVGEKFYLMFGVSNHVNLPNSFIVFQVQQFDTYSYLFNEPFFISLSDQVPTDPISIKGIRIGVNGQEASIGQAFGNVNINVDASNYSAETGAPLSTLGAVIALEKGADNDEFFLTFDQIGSSQYTRVEPSPPAAAVPQDLEPQSNVALRNFEEIDATIARVTGVSRASVKTFFEQVRQQLPSNENVEGFLAAHQSGVMQLTAAYCAELASDTTLRAEYFPLVSFGEALTSANSAGVIDPLLTALTANTVNVDGETVSLATQPDPTLVRNELNNMIDSMSVNTQTKVTAVCSAVVGSAVMLLQ